MQCMAHWYKNGPVHEDTASTLFKSDTRVSFIVMLKFCEAKKKITVSLPYV